VSFNSIEFLLFFPVVVTVYFLLPHRYRWILLLLSSYYFYMSWKAEYIILIFVSTVADYIAGLKIYGAKTKNVRKFYLGLSLVINLGFLFLFKYFNFFSESARLFLSNISIQMHPTTLKLLLPVGISFYTFQTLGYTIDIYRGKIKPEKHFGIFAVYVSFFPQLVAGPIERAKNLIPQFYKKQFFDYERVVDGMKLMLWGMFKKVVIADRLAVMVNIIYGDVYSYSGMSLVIATVFFAFQIYCDFSGYSDIAIGAAQIMGIKLMDNFKRPYFSKSISEFWKRWHISLSTWFKDYLYIPLGGNRVKLYRLCINILVVFLVSGLWHGASWTFVIWGALHGFYLVISTLTKPLRTKLVQITALDHFPKLHSGIQIFSTFVLVNIGWVFFRSQSLSDAYYVLNNIFKNSTSGISGFLSAISPATLILGITSILFLIFIHTIQELKDMRHFLSSKNIIFRWSMLLLMLFAILFFGVFEETEFIYFQF
jgi:alginate O-acetyltransferase complex protein AlgI